MSDPAERTSGVILIGTQGFSYDGWNGLLYPPGTRPADRLARYARTFPLVEIDRTFYGPPRASEVDRWISQTPETFRFTAKVPRQITHDARLQGPDALRQLEDFLKTITRLGDRLGAVVLQLGPGFQFPRDADGLSRTLRLLPTIAPPSLRVAVEFRHPSWIEAPDVEARLREARIAWVWNDWEPGPNPWAAMPRAIDEPRAFRETADFAYLRLTGDHDITIDYQTITIDRGADLRRWAELISKWRENQMKKGRTSDVFVLLNNHYSGSSPRSASALRQLLDLPQVQFGAEAEWPSPTASASIPMRLPGF
ncbi:hypothetical protein LBMAG38_13040 [Chloroflexota bacterium]|nr:hypothetical protein LBMAG38_13040 [Chloroflexota bacterium]